MQRAGQSCCHGVPRTGAGRLRPLRHPHQRRRRQPPQRHNRQGILRAGRSGRRHQELFRSGRGGRCFRFQSQLHGDSHPRAGVRPRYGRARGLQYYQHFIDERLHAAHQNSGVFGREIRCVELYAVAGGAFFQGRHSCERHCAGLLLRQAECGASVEPGRHADGADEENSCCDPNGPLRTSGRTAWSAAVPAQQ